MGDYKVKLSIRGGSGLSIQDFNTCPQLFNLKMQGVRFNLTPTYFVTGRIVHDNFERILCDQTPVTQEKLDEIYSLGSMAEAGKELETTFEPDTKPPKFIPKILNKFKELKDEGKFGEIIEHESYYEGSLIDPATFQPDKELAEEGIIFAGRIDLVNKVDGKLFITDFKTTKSALKQSDADSSTQLTMYSYLWINEHKVLIDSVGLVYFTKHVRDETQAAYLKTIRHKEDYDSLYRNLHVIGKGVSNCINTGEWPKKGMIQDCKRTYNQLCPYHPMCFPERYTREELKLFDQGLKE